MDRIDAILLEAWERVSEKVRSKRIMALKRSRRRFMGVLTRPMREWCLVVRASDLRINEWPDNMYPPDAAAAHEEHELQLTGGLIRELTKPIMIDWPGVKIEEAARLLGRDYQTLYAWVRKGVFRVDRYREHKFPEHWQRPYVWTPSPIDANNFLGRTPNRVWGTLWQYLWKEIPEEYTQTITRVPRFYYYRNTNCERFLGWDFICPGRVDEHGEVIRECGRRCRYLFGPQTVWTLPAMLGIDVGFEMPKGSGLAGTWHPGLTDTVAAPGTRTFACNSCWKLQSSSMADSHGWNYFVTHISGGLLRGRDIKRPLDEVPYVRVKKEFKRRWQKKPPPQTGVQDNAKTA